MFRPLAVLFSTLAHVGVVYLILFHPAFHSGPVFKEPMRVKLVDLPSGLGGSIEPTLLTPEKPAAARPEPDPPRTEPPKATLPGPEKPEPSKNTATVKSQDRGRAPGLGHGGPAGLGGKGAGVILDQADFEYHWYKARLEDALKANWRKPVYTGGDTKTASVHFVIHVSGEVKDVQLINSSGDPAFDQSVLRAVYDAAPYPKFPPAYEGKELGVLYTFELLPGGKPSLR